MSDESERGVQEELAAMNAVGSALATLDKAAANRVVEWARARFVDNEPLPEWDTESFSKFMKTTAEVSQQIGGMTGLDVLKAAAYIVSSRDAAEEKSSP